MHPLWENVTYKASTLECWFMIRFNTEYIYIIIEYDEMMSRDTGL